MSPNETERRRRFRERVEFERAVIQMVNRTFPDGEGLTGLARAAIDRWTDQRSGGSAPEQVENVATTLHKLSRAASLLADRSRTVFDYLGPEVFEPNELLLLIKNDLREVGIEL